jgi:hypothetical protein
MKNTDDMQSNKDMTPWQAFKRLLDIATNAWWADLLGLIDAESGCVIETGEQVFPLALMKRGLGAEETLATVALYAGPIGTPHGGPLEYLRRYTTTGLLAAAAGRMTIRTPDPRSIFVRACADLAAARPDYRRTVNRMLWERMRAMVDDPKDRRKPTSDVLTENPYHLAAAFGVVPQAFTESCAACGAKMLWSGLCSGEYWQEYIHRKVALALSDGVGAEREYYELLGVGAEREYYELKNATTLSCVFVDKVRPADICDSLCNECVAVYFHAPGEGGVQ